MHKCFVLLYSIKNTHLCSLIWELGQILSVKKFTLSIACSNVIL